MTIAAHNIRALEDLLEDARLTLDELNECGDLEDRLEAAETVARLEKQLAQAKRTTAGGNQ